MKRTISKKVSIPCLVIIVVLVVALIIGNYYAIKYSPIISTYLGQTTYKVTEGEPGEDTVYFKSIYSSEDERLEADAEAGKEASEESIVMLKNENSLPLSSGKKVTLFGVNSADILYGGGGSGTVDASTAPTMKTALEASGFEVNDVMWDFYTTGAAADIRMDVADMAGTGRYVIHEAAPDMFTDTETSSFSEYGDAAIVTFSRSGSESADIPVTYDESYLEAIDIDGFMGTVHSEGLDSEEDLGRSYLSLTKTEEDLLEYVNGYFDNVIVVINSGNAMELGFLDEDKYGVDACLWIGNPGQDGLYALGEIMNGNVNPSGRLVDTYAYDATGAPAVQNFGNNIMENAEDTMYNTYVVYEEGIYVGYKYYETRYEDVVLDQGGAAAAPGITADGNSTWVYADEVQFPFGYGQSYTTFTEELTDSSQSGDEFTFDIKVTNTGDVAGKDVVEIYLQSPYTDYDKQAGIEKAAVQLVGFAKTDTIQPGEDVTVTITVDESELKAYDATANDGAGTYILEAGDYYFAVASDAHQAVNTILGAKGASGMDGEAEEGNAVSFTMTESDKYQVSTHTGNEIENQFSDADMRTYDSDFTYLTRNDWSGTYPEFYQVVATEEMIDALAIPEGTDDPDAEMPETGQENGLTLAMMRDVDINDELWDDLMNEVTAEEMYNLVRVGGYQTQPVSSVSAPATVCVDGPAYVGNAGTTGVNLVESTYAWCSEVVLASSWNVDVLEKMGTMIGQDCLAQGSLNFVGWYAPSMNIHRTAYSGRNFEYYSEDGFLSGQMGAATTKGATSEGVICFDKHYALNDQETNRIGLSTFANEQSIREIYLKPFETSITEGGSLGVMASMNRIGLTWSGDHYGLSTEVLRNEWGFNGILITDQASYPESFPLIAIRGGLEGGVDLYLNSGSDNWQIDNYQSNATVMSQLRTASKHILYAVSRSAAMNGISSTATVEKTMPQWQIWLIIADVVIGLLAAAGIVILALKTKWNNKK